MRKLVLGFLILSSVFSLAQNKNEFNFSIAGNYPINISDTKLSRQLGINVSFDYSRLILDKFIFRTGVGGDFYSEMINRKEYRTDLFIPVQLGYRLKKFDLLAGVWYSILMATKKNSYDPGLNYDPTYEGLYYDTSPYTTMDHLGISLSVDYNILKDFCICLNLRYCHYSHPYVQDSDFTYIINNVGVKYKL